MSHASYCDDFRRKYWLSQERAIKPVMFNLPKNNEINF